MEAKNMKTEELIGALVELDKQGKENRALTNKPNGSIVGAIREREGHKNKYTIVEEKNGWGRLKSGAGWISLEFCKKAS